MKILLIVTVLLFFYLRRPFKCIMNINKAMDILCKYNSFFEAPESEKKHFFLEIARIKPLTDTLLVTFFESAPSYDDFYDKRKIQRYYTWIHEFIDVNRFNFKNYFHPKYFIRDLFFFPSAVLGFLLRFNFGKINSFVVSFFTWMATIFISAYSLEIKLFINALISKLI